ncbi:MAG: hypothetical protein HY074_06005 [Deltaproteobacteria bacterium]|nr:hypothetical protein [Deltaproteobacteria bacterium]
MTKRSGLAMALCSIAALTAMILTGCNPVGDFHDLVEGGNEALLKEDMAFRQLKSSAPARGEAAISDLSGWVGTLNNLKTVMSTANEKLSGKAAQKIRASQAVQTALSRFKSGIDEVLGRSYADAGLKLVPPWRMGDAQAIAMQVPNTLKAIGSYYQAIFSATNPYAGRSFTIDVQQDEAILDTYQGCVEKVEMAARGQAKSNYCVNAARAACGHQIDLGCVQGKMMGALANNICPDVKTFDFTIPANEPFNPNAHINGGTEELKEWKYGRIVTEPNPDRNVATFCPGQFNPEAKAVMSSMSCYGYGPKVRIYGYNQDRHVQIEIEGVKHANDPRKDVKVNMYAEGRYVGQHVIRPDYGWNNNVYTFMITESAFQYNSMVRLEFLDMVDVDVTDQATGQLRHKTAHWVVDAQIKGEDVPFLTKKEVRLTKYMPNAWVGGIVRSCAAQAPVLK